MATPSRNLTLKQERFAIEYVRNGGNASAAYRAAYNAQNMNEATVADEAYHLTRHPEVAPMIDQLEAEARTEAGLTPGFLASKLLRNLDDAADVGQYAASNRAAELIGRGWLGLFKDGPAIDARSINVTITDSGVRDGRLAEFTYEQLKAMAEGMQAPAALAPSVQEPAAEADG